MVSNTEMRRQIEEELIGALRRGVAPWQKPWTPGTFGTAPFNAHTGKPYTGGNIMRLDLAAAVRGYTDPRWLTYHQATQMKAHVRAGSKGTRIERWVFEKEERVEDENGEVTTRKVRRAKPKPIYAYLFNAEQVEGLEEYVAPAPKFTPLENGERLLAAAGVNITHSGTDGAYYSVARDQVVLPHRASFETAYGFYSTALHEVAHSTMHASRLDRPEGRAAVFGSPDYAREELRAEMASMLIARETGIGNELAGHASYVDNWVAALDKNINEIFKAARDADIIAAYVMHPEKRQELRHKFESGRTITTDTEDPKMAIPQNGRRYLNVPFAEKDEAKELGAKFDGSKKLWYAPASTDIGDFAKWDAPAPAEDRVAPAKEFGDFIRSSGLALAGEPIMDGRWHRVPLANETGSGKSGSYRGWSDGRPNGHVHNFRTGDRPVKWVATGTPLDAKTKAKLRAEQKVSQAKREAAEARRVEEARRTAYGVWTNAAPATPDDCAYLASKGVGAHGCKRTEDGKLIVPGKDIDGNLRTIQFVGPEEKRFLSGGAKKGCMHIIDPRHRLGRGPIIVAEGFSTAASIHESTGRPAVVAFDAGNLEPVVQALRIRHPSADIVIAADDDHASQRNTGIEKARAAATEIGGRVVIVGLDAKQKAAGATDFDDLRRLAGTGRVREQIEAGLKQAPVLGAKSRGLAPNASRSIGRTPNDGRSIG